MFRKANDRVLIYGSFIVLFGGMISIIVFVPEDYLRATMIGFLVLDLVVVLCLWIMHIRRQV
jgi:hypothetical protein